MKVETATQLGSYLTLIIPKIFTTKNCTCKADCRATTQNTCRLLHLSSPLLLLHWHSEAPRGLKGGQWWDGCNDSGVVTYQPQAACGQRVGHRPAWRSEALCSHGNQPCCWACCWTRPLWTPRLQRANTRRQRGRTIRTTSCFFCAERAQVGSQNTIK